MSYKIEYKSAFPTNEFVQGVMEIDKGMSLRDYFAAKAMSTMNLGGLSGYYDGLSENAYKMADAMLKARSI